MVLSLFCCSSFSPAFAYSDISLGTPLYPAIQYLTAKNFITGYEDGSFQPEKPVNRAEALKMILVATEQDLTAEGEGFPDVPAKEWYTPYVLYAQDQGIVKGDPSGNFVPARQVNRAEFLKMVLESFDVNPADYELDVFIADVSSDDWFAPYIRFAAQFDILDLDQFKNAKPGEFLTRGDASFLVYKTLESGRGLDPQVMLSLVESHLVNALSVLQNKDMLTAGLNVQVAQYFSNIALEFLPENNVVKAAHNTTEAVNSLIGSYIASENGQLDDIIVAAKEAWSAADKIQNVGSAGLQDMAFEIKTLASAMADSARGKKNDLADE